MTVNIIPADLYQQYLIHYQQCKSFLCAAFPVLFSLLPGAKKPLPEMVTAYILKPGTNRLLLFDYFLCITIHSLQNINSGTQLAHINHHKAVCNQDCLYRFATHINNFCGSTG